MPLRASARGKASRRADPGARRPLVRVSPPAARATRSGGSSVKSHVVVEGLCAPSPTPFAQLATNRACRTRVQSLSKAAHGPRWSRRSNGRGTTSRRVVAHPLRFRLSATFLAVLTSAGRASAAETEGEEVHVRGDLLPPASRDSSVASTVVKAEQLRAPGARTADLLRSQPGVQVAESGGAGSLATAGVRGASSAQTSIVGRIR